MKKEKITRESILFGIIGLLAGVLLTVFVATVSVNTNNQIMMRMMGMNTSLGNSSMGMDEMTGELKGKTGDDFDKAFIAGMIVHHQGAIDMANLAKQNAKHDEIKKLADDIIAAQTKEIGQMKAWQSQWGYPAEDDTMGGMHH